MNSSLKKLALLILLVLPLTDCTSPIQGENPQEEHRFFATGFVREHGFWLCGNYGLMLEHCDCADCPKFENDLMPVDWDFGTLDFEGKYVGVEGFWFEDTLGLCPMIVVESVKEIPIRYRCGDVNHDWKIDVVDAKLIINYVGASDPLPYEYKIADTNCDASVNFSDAVLIINYVYQNGPPPCDENRDRIPDC